VWSDFNSAFASLSDNAFDMLLLYVVLTKNYKNFL
jgi:hypothetical protein